MVEDGDDEGTLTIEDRVSDMSSGSAEDSDMQINVDKTKVIHVGSGHYHHLGGDDSNLHVQMSPS